MATIDWKVGDLVEAKIFGKWRPAEIVEIFQSEATPEYRLKYTQVDQLGNPYDATSCKTSRLIRRREDEN